MATGRDAYVTAQDDHRRTIPHTGRAPDRMLRIRADDRRLAVHHEHECSLETHHGERLIARVQHQRAHSHPLEIACTACRRSTPLAFRETGGSAVTTKKHCP